MAGGHRPPPGVTAAPLALPAARRRCRRSRSTPDDYVGDTAARTGFAGLEALDDVTMVAVPRRGRPPTSRGCSTTTALKAVQLGDDRPLRAAGRPHGDARHPARAERAAGRPTGAARSPATTAKFAALYWPWISVHDPATGAATAVPPSGHVAGLWARTDADPRRAQGARQRRPARRRRRRAADHPRASTTGSTRSASTSSARFPGRGIRVCGARTLSSDPAWRYVNVRRLFNYVEGSLLNGTQWVVFEPNDRDAVGPRQPHRRRLPARRLARRRAVRRQPGGGVLRQVRRRDQPAGGHRGRPARHRDRHRARSSPPSSSSSGWRRCRAASRRSPSERAHATAPPPRTTDRSTPWPASLTSSTRSPPTPSTSRSTGSSLAQFQEVSGLGITITPIEVRQQSPTAPMKLPVLRKVPGQVSYNDITLKRGTHRRPRVLELDQRRPRRQDRQGPQAAARSSSWDYEQGIAGKWTFQRAWPTSVRAEPDGRQRRRGPRRDDRALRRLHRVGGHAVTALAAGRDGRRSSPRFPFELPHGLRRRRGRAAPPRA